MASSAGLQVKEAGCEEAGAAPVAAPHKFRAKTDQIENINAREKRRGRAEHSTGVMQKGGRGADK